MYERCHLEFRNEPKFYKTFANDEQYIIIKKKKKSFCHKIRFIIKETYFVMKTFIIKIIYKKKS